MKQLKAEAERVYNEMQNYTPGSEEYEHLLGECKQIQAMITEREMILIQRKAQIGGINYGRKIQHLS